MCQRNENQGREHGEPGFGKKAVNLAKAAIKHAVDSVKKLEESKYQSRLEICGTCSSCDLNRMICLHMDCGCQVTRKARWSFLPLR